MRSAMLKAVVVLGIAGCAALAPQPREVVVALPQIEQAIGRHFSGTRTFLAVFDVSLSNPKVTLRPDGNRVRADMDVTIVNALAGGTLRGGIAISGGLRFDPAVNAVRLVEPRAEDFRVEGVPERWSEPVSRVGAWVTEQVLRDVPLYTLRPEDLRVGGTQYAPSAFVVRSDGIAVTLAPRPQ